MLLWVSGGVGFGVAVELTQASLGCLEWFCGV